jgi:hypothetical protein
MDEENKQKTKKPIFILAPRHRKVAVGEYTYNSAPEVQTVIVRPKDKNKGKAKIKKSLSGNDGYDSNEYDQFSLINLITYLMEKDYIEKALVLINIFFARLTPLEKKLLAANILEATKQYSIPSASLPEAYYDFMISNESDEIL